MNYTCLYVPKDSGTYSEVFLLFGLEKLVSIVLNQIGRGRQSRIMNHGSYYELILPVPLTDEMLGRVKFEYCAPYILEKEGQEEPEGQMINLPENYAILKKLKELRKLKKTNLEPEVIEQFRVVEGFDIARGIKDLKAITTYNAVLSGLIEKRAEFGQIVQAIFDWFSTPFQLDKTLPPALKNFSKKTITKLSIFNPLAGKGAHHPGPGNVTPLNKDSYWFIEWLKFIGIYQMGFVRSVGDDSKVYALEPMEVDSTQLHHIKQRFAQSLPNAVLSPVKTDIVMILKYLETILLYYQENPFSSDEVDYTYMIEGLHTAYFLNMGQAKAVSNISFLNLPSWIQLRTFDERDLFTQVIQNHLKVINALSEDGTTTKMLQDYRDFLVGEDLYKFFDFYAPYAELLLGQVGEPMERRRYKYVVPFMDRYLSEVICRMDSKLTRIIHAEGFKNLARAIRKSTISLQYKPKTERQYEVRYGIAQDLKRKSNRIDLLVEYLSEFVASYNQENARISERTGTQFRKNITEEDLNEVFGLIAEYGTIVGKLLMAYGYAREEKEDPSGNASKNLEATATDEGDVHEQGDENLDTRSQGGDEE